MIKCSVESCESNFNSDLRSSVTFFDFPQCKDIKRFNKWVEALGKSPEYFKREGKFVCSRHFRLEDFKRNLLEEETMFDVKKSLNLLENAVPNLYLFEDKNNFRLPLSDIKTEIKPSVNFIINVNCIKTEKVNEEKEDLEKNEDSSSINNSNSVFGIPIKNVILKQEPQEEKTFELTAEENISIESRQVADFDNQPNKSPADVKEAHNKSDDLIKKKFRCVDCKETFAWSTELKKHKRITHGTYKCNICLKHVVKLSNLKIHKKTKHNISYVFSCKDCNEAFFRNKELLKHMKTHKKIQTDRCTKCRKKFESDAEFSSHECIIGKKLFQCNTCRKCFVGERNLNTHKKKFHLANNKDKELEKYECDICKKTFEKSYRLAQHKRLHEKPYKCEICKKGFGERTHLKVHKLNHAAVECVHLGRMNY